MISALETMYSHFDVALQSRIIPTQCMTQFSHHLTTMRSDKTCHVLTHTSLKIVMPISQYLHIDDYV